MLERADSIKSSDKDEFFKLVEQANLNFNEFTKEQREYFQYLQSYKLSLEGNFEDSVARYENLLATAESFLIKVRAKISLVNIHGITRNYNRAFYYLESLTEDIPSIKDSEIKSLAHLAAAFNYNAYQQYKLSKEYSAKLLAEKPRGRTLCFARQLYIEADFHLNPRSSNDVDLDKAIEHCLEVGEPIAGIALHNIKARLLLDERKPQDAIDYLIQHENLVRKTEYPSALSRFYITFAKAKWQLREAGDAEKYAKKVLDISKGEEYVKPKVFAYSLLHEIAKEKGDFKLALDHYVNYSEADKAQINEILTQQLAYNIVEHQTEEKVQEIKLLNKQNEVLKLEQDLAKEEAQNNRLIVLLLIFFLASLAFWTYRVKRHQIRLKKQSETDLLTGVCSRHHFYHTSRKLLEYAKANNQNVSFILFDMDRFKSVNDNYGHLVGDWVLKKAIEVARPCWRQNDIAGRLGGEEFALMLPTCDLQKAVEIAENCRKAIEAIDTTGSGHKFSISASFGVTTSKVSGFELSKLIGDADKIMYQAKAAGKNQVLQVANKS
ncbi:MAG: GGDEF domain-containing protein [Gammaproteobacteria bacterium]|nr:GGDEF domain-containing protein [Gammaproteobacteria bacterium]